MHQKRGRDAERNQVRQRIKFTPERTVRAAQPRHPAVEQVKNAGQQNEGEGELDLGEIEITRRIGFDDFGQRHEAAKQVARRQQVRQEINFQLALFMMVGRRGRGMGRGHNRIQSKAAITVWPPTTRSPSFTLILARRGR